MSKEIELTDVWESAYITCPAISKPRSRASTLDMTLFDLESGDAKQIEAPYLL